MLNGKLYITDADGDYTDAFAISTINNGTSNSVKQYYTFKRSANDMVVTTGSIPMSIVAKADNLSIMPSIEKVIFNDPATIVVWSDGTKTVVKARQKGRKKDKFSKEYGLAMAIAKKYCGNRSRFVKLVKEGKDAG